MLNQLPVVVYVISAIVDDVSVMGFDLHPDGTDGMPRDECFWNDESSTNPARP